MGVLRRLLAFLVIRALVAAVVGMAALYLAVGGDRFWQARGILRGQPQVWQGIARAVR